jgi:integrase
VQIELDYLNAIDAKGRRYWYYRRNGKNIRVAGDYGSPGFLESYSRIHEQHELGRQAAPTAKPGSLTALIAEYKTKKAWRDLEPDTKRSYQSQLIMLTQEYGHLAVRTMPRPFIIRLRDKFDDKPRTANLLVQVMSILLQLGWDLGYCDSNVAARIKPLETGDGHRPWEESEIKLYRKKWLLGTVERTAFELLLNTGQRGSDIIKMQRSHIGDDGMISVKQDKTDERVWIPISAELKEALAAWDLSQAAWVNRRQTQKRTVHADVEKMILTGHQRRAIGVDGFRHLMIDAYKVIDGLTAGLADDGVTNHGLRYAAAARLRELGCSLEDIAAITGHETVAMVEKYAGKKRRAKIAIGKLDAGTSAQKAGEVQNRT